MKYWYHFAIMFEALLFSLRLTPHACARFLVGELLRRFYQKLEGQTAAGSMLLRRWW